jgi:hypothetical protein
MNFMVTAAPLLFKELHALERLVAISEPANPLLRSERDKLFTL